MMKFGNGRWEEVGRLGGGGQGTAYEVVCANGNPQHYALKTTNRSDEQAIERFRREIEISETLAHPNVIRPVEHDVNANPPFVVYELCVGGNLDKQKEVWSSDLNFALQIFEDVCVGLAAAHFKGFVHRDIKPQNILLKEARGPAVVADFGIAYSSEDARLTQTSEIVGPRIFMAPELEHGGVHDIFPSADVYSLGKLLYYLLSGGKVLSREDFRQPHFDLVGLHKNGRFERVNLLLDRMVVREPEKRFQDAKEVLTAFKAMAELLKGQYNMVGSKVPQPCLYCGQGSYQLTVKAGDNINKTSHEDFYYFVGFKALTSSDWRMLVCDNCGHVQWFRVEKAKTKW